MEHEYISTPAQFEDLLARLEDSPVLAIDTEFVSEKRYRPELCLLQLCSGDGEIVAIVDPLAKGMCDIAPFWELLTESGRVTIVHSGHTEVEFAIAATDHPPRNLFDIQIASGFIGHEYPAGYANLVTRFLNIQPSKGETRSDWMKRPLTPKQIKYGIQDVLYLPKIYNRLLDQLEQLDRLDWVEEEMTTFAMSMQSSFSGAGWQGLSGIASLSRRNWAIARELWHWREEIAKNKNHPRAWVLRDDLLVALAKRADADPETILQVRGLDRSDMRRRIDEIVACVERGLAVPENELPVRRGSRKPSIQNSVLGQFLFAALGSKCREIKIAPALAGGPSDVRNYLAYREGEIDTPPKLMHGWRAEILGNLFDELLDGKLRVEVDNPKQEAPLKFTRPK